MGLHFLGHYLGIDGHPEMGDGHSWLILPAREPNEPVTDVALGVLVDLAMGQAVRTKLEPGMRLATSSLVLHAAPLTYVRPIEVRAAVQWLDGGDAHSRTGGTAAVTFAVTTADGRTVATGSGSFVTLPAQSGHNDAIVDWSQASMVTTVRRDELNPHEAAAVDGVEAAARRGSVADGLLDLRWRAIDGDTLLGELLVGPQHGNRVGDLQGGLVYGIGATAARRLFADRRRIVDGQVLYLRPVGHGPLMITATVLRRGRRMAFVRVVLNEAGKEQSAELTYTLGAEGSA
jgi:acyl-coenzyme A thioesterase PaaI-like protein